LLAVGTFPLSGLGQGLAYLFLCPPTAGSDAKVMLANAGSK